MRTLLAAAAVALGLPLAACASVDQTGTLVHRVKVWESGTGYAAAVQAIDADVARIDAARRGGAEPGVVEFDCVTLGQDVNKDYSSDLPSPDQALTMDLNTAFGDYYSYATDCVAHKGAPAAMGTLGHYLTTANRALAAAQARSKAILG